MLKGWLLIYVLLLPWIKLVCDMEEYTYEFRTLTKLRHKLIKLRHHEEVYKRCLAENITPKGLRLKKKPCLGKVSIGLERRWSNVLRWAERKLILALKGEAVVMQEQVSSEFQARVREYTRSRGDQIVKQWLISLERSEQVWIQELAARRKAKFRRWMGKKQERRRRALSFEAIRDLRTLISKNVANNDRLKNAVVQDNLEDDYAAEDGGGAEFEDQVQSNQILIEGEQIQAFSDDTAREESSLDNESQGHGSVMQNVNEQLVSGKFIRDNVVNISRRLLTSAEISLLSKGLKFCPTPKELDWAAIKSDVKEFGRKIKCKAYFNGVCNVESEGRNFRRFNGKSDWVPDKVEPAIEVYCSKLEEKICSINCEGRNYSNLSSEELQALRCLKGYRDIVIKEADKGSAVVVWDREDYCREAYNHLNDVSVYEEISYDPLGKVSDRVEQSLQPLVEKGYVDRKNLKYLVLPRPRLGRFYLLPKIHKRLENVPGRPVISNCGTATERVSEFLDYHIQPLVDYVPSIIRDTTHFLQRLEALGHIPATAIMCTIDVVGLYPHIPHKEGLEALERFMNKAGGEWPVSDLVSLAKLVLESNYFEFDDKRFRQKLGTAIGTKFAPGYANIFMGCLEEEFLNNCELRPWVWWRFLDDVFMIWLHGEEELNKFLVRLNSFHETIKFTWEFSSERISFLDVRVTKVDGAFQTDVYSKPTDAHQYLNFKSCHPPHVKKGIPYSQALRLKRICSGENQLKERLGELKGYLVKRGYKGDFVESQFSRMRNLRRGDLLERKQRDEMGNKNVFVIDYHPALRDLYGIFKELQQIVGWSGSFLNIMPDPPMICFRRAKNLKDHLVRSKLPKEQDAIGGMYKCGSKKCKVCENVIEGATFKSFVEGRTFHINHHFDCNSEGVIYLVNCNSCSKQYVGCTITPFRSRFNNHKSSLKRYGEGKRNICGQQLYAHFYGQGHNGLKDFKVQIIDITNANNPTERESFWIEKINCYVPLGLNDREEC